MANEVEIVITSKNKAKPAVEAAKRDAEGLGKAYKNAGKTATSALDHVRDALTKGVRDSIADVNGETNRMSRAFRAVQESATRSLDSASARIRARFTRLIGENDGRSMGRRLVSGIAGSISSSAGKLKNALSEGLSGAAKGLTSTPFLGTLIVGAIGTAIVAAGPQLAMMLAGTLTLGLGGAVVGIGVALLAQNKKVKADFVKTWSEIKTIMTDAAKPLLPVLDEARKAVKSVVKDLAPEIEKGFKATQRPMKDFVRNLGEGFKELKPAIGPLFASFGEVLDAIGPHLPGVFAEIGAAVANMAKTVSENRDIFAALFIGLLRSIPLVINLLSSLAGMFRGVLTTALGFGDGVLAVFQGIMEAAASIPGPWQDAAREMANSIAGTRERLAGMRADLDNFPKIVKLEGNIRDLDAKIKTAKRALNDKNLTKTRRAALRAEISQLLAAKRRAQAEIDSLRGKTVYMHVAYTSSGRSVLNGAVSRGAYDRAHGGIIGGATAFAQGGISGAGGSVALVGEQGPELVRLPFGSNVIPAGTTQAMMSNPATSGFNSVSMAFRAATGGGGGTGDIASGLKDLTRALREIITLREGMDKLTGSIFGQERALSAYEAAWDAARKSLKENGRRLSLSTEKGRENRAALLSLAEAAQEVVATMAERGRSITSVTKKMAEQRLEFLRIARAMGLTSKQAKALADRYGLIPRKVKTVLTEERKDAAYNRKAEAFNAKLEKSGKASGGIAGGWTLVGERGAELVRLPYGSTVVPNGTTQAMMSGGGQPAPVVLEIKSGGARMDDLLLEVLRRAVRVRGGNVQLVLGRS